MLLYYVIMTLENLSLVFCQWLIFQTMITRYFLSIAILNLESKIHFLFFVLFNLSWPLLHPRLSSHLSILLFILAFHPRLSSSPFILVFHPRLSSSPLCLAFQKNEKPLYVRSYLKVLQSCWFKLTSAQKVNSFWVLFDLTESGNRLFDLSHNFPRYQHSTLHSSSDANIFFSRLPSPADMVQGLAS